MIRKTAHLMFQCCVLFLIGLAVLTFLRLVYTPLCVCTLFDGNPVRISFKKSLIAYPSYCGTECHRPLEVDRLYIIKALGHAAVCNCSQGSRGGKE